jgi:hypothetical protein
MDDKVESFYREIFDDPYPIDGVDREEAAELNEFLNELNPPPDKLVWLRATAFEIGCEFLSDDDDGDDDDDEDNVNLLRTINFLVHAIETMCMQ